MTGEYKRIQVKTIRLRGDRANEMVVYAKKGSGDIYRKADADYFAGVLVNEGETPRVWLFENREIGEYWCGLERAADRWVELPITLNRGIYEEAGAACTAH
ncbi:hypothetical protein [Paenibacillus sp. SI8]|uniref:hypothetical protein n=1 Tax=unclassified Paenibacillus TaxID=185978 RepID=UPI003465ADA9